MYVSFIIPTALLLHFYVEQPESANEDVVVDGVHSSTDDGWSVFHGNVPIVIHTKAMPPSECNFIYLWPTKQNQLINQNKQKPSTRKYKPCHLMVKRCRSASYFYFT